GGGGGGGGVGERAALPAARRPKNAAAATRRPAAAGLPAGLWTTNDRPASSRGPLRHSHAGPGAIAQRDGQSTQVPAAGQVSGQRASLTLLLSTTCSKRAVLPSSNA